MIGRRSFFAVLAGGVGALVSSVAWALPTKSALGEVLRRLPTLSLGEIDQLSAAVTAESYRRFAALPWKDRMSDDFLDIGSTNDWSMDKELYARQRSSNAEWWEKDGSPTRKVLDSGTVIYYCRVKPDVEYRLPQASRRKTVRESMQAGWIPPCSDMG